MSARHAKELSKARSLFNDKKRSGCLIFFNAAISLGKRRDCSRVSTR